MRHILPQTVVKCCCWVIKSLPGATPVVTALQWWVSPRCTLFEILQDERLYAILLGIDLPATSLENTGIPNKDLSGTNI